MRKQRESSPRPARLCLDGYAGRSSVSVEVLGEIEKRYRVRLLEDALMPHRSPVAEGDVLLVPKHNVVLK